MRHGGPVVVPRQTGITWLGRLAAKSVGFTLSTRSAGCSLYRFSSRFHHLQEPKNDPEIQFLQRRIPMPVDDKRLFRPDVLRPLLTGFPLPAICRSTISVSHPYQS